MSKTAKKPLKFFLVSLPLLLFLFFRLSPSLDTALWIRSWNSNLLQYYSGTFASFMALIAGLFANNAFKKKNSWEAMLISIGFFVLSSLFFLSSLTTPTIISDGWNRTVFLWSLRLSMPLTFITFALATFKWPQQLTDRLVQHRKWIFSGATILFFLLAFLANANQEGLGNFFRFDPYLPIGLMLLTVFLAYRVIRGIQRANWFDNKTTESRLILAIILLTETYIILTIGVVPRLSWLVYHLTLQLGLIMAILAILNTFQAARDVQITRYFAVLGSILIVGLSFISVEFGFSVLSSGSTISRTVLMPLMIGQAFLNFILLYVIVLHLGRINSERTEELKREQHLRSELTQLIVHDLKSPLTVILSGMNLLNKESLGSLTPTQKKLLSSLEQSGQNILLMINDLLDVERFESGVFQLQPRLTNMEGLLRDQVSKLDIIAGSQNQTLQLVIEPVLPELRIDPVIMRRVLDNILGNALKFTPENGRIHVNAAVVDDWLKITIADNGPGVPADARHQIFEKFGQVKGVERRGAGLGLTFCKMALEAHNGLIQVSEALLGGAEFVIWLPTKPPAANLSSKNQTVLKAPLTAASDPQP